MSSLAFILKIYRCVIIKVIKKQYLPHIPCGNPTASKPCGRPNGARDAIGGIPGGSGPCGCVWCGWCDEPYVCGCGPNSVDLRKPAIRASVEWSATLVIFLPLPKIDNEKKSLFTFLNNKSTI